MKNVKDSLGGPGESIYEKTKYKDIFLNAKTNGWLSLLEKLTDNQKQLNREFMARLINFDMNGW